MVRVAQYVVRYYTSPPLFTIQKLLMMKDHVIVQDFLLL